MPGPTVVRLLASAALAALLAVPGLAIPQVAAGKPATTAASARIEAGGPPWSSLTAEQRQVLAPLQRDWSSIDAPRKSKWLEVAARFPTLAPEERKRLQERMAEWARMTPTERGRVRLGFQEAKQLAPQERQARWEAYQALPEDERRALADRAKPAAADRNRPAVASAPLDAAVPKQNTVAGKTALPPVKPVAPTIVQAKPGATTTLMTQPPAPPPHHQAGQPKIAAKPNQVDSATLLPKKGPQAPHPPTAAASAAPRQP